MWDMYCYYLILRQGNLSDFLRVRKLAMVDVRFPLWPSDFSFHVCNSILSSENHTIGAGGYLRDHPSGFQTSEDICFPPAKLSLSPYQ